MSGFTNTLGRPAYICVRCGAKLESQGTICANCFAATSEEMREATPAEKQQKEFLDNVLAKFSATIRRAQPQDYDVLCQELGSILAKYYVVLTYLNHGNSV